MAPSVYLDSGFSQIDFECQLLPGVDVRVVGLREDPLQLLELHAGERGPDAPLLPLLVQSAVVREEFVGNWKRKKTQCQRSVRACVCDVVKWELKSNSMILFKISLC